MGVKYRLKNNVGKHFLPAERGKTPIPMEVGTIVDEEDIPSAARDKFELAVPRGEDGKVRRSINNLLAVPQGDGKWEVVHRITKKKVHEDFLTINEAQELLGEPIEDEEEKTAVKRTRGKVKK